MYLDIKRAGKTNVWAVIHSCVCGVLSDFRMLTKLTLVAVVKAQT
jgi:hypothetical protein